MLIYTLSSLLRLSFFKLTVLFKFSSTPPLKSTNVCSHEKIFIYSARLYLTGNINNLETAREDGQCIIGLVISEICRPRYCRNNINLGIGNINLLKIFNLWQMDCGQKHFIWVMACKSLTADTSDYLKPHDLKKKMICMKYKMKT